MSFFTPAQVAELEVLLRMEAAEVITASSTIQRIIERTKANNRRGSIKTARAWAKSVQKHAAALADLLSDAEPDVPFFLSQHASLRQLEPEDYDLFADEASQLALDLDAIASGAMRISSDDDALRELFSLEGPVSFEVKTLWPILFAVYIGDDLRLTYSPGGPLHRFISIVHDAAGLDPPNPNTLKKVAGEWRAKPASAWRFRRMSCKRKQPEPG